MATSNAQHRFVDATGLSVSGKCLIVLTVILCSMMAARAQSERAAKPNILVIVADDLGYADVGFHGCKDIPTPNIDSLAKNGVRCTNGYVSGPYCSPTRAGLLTGRYQQRFGHEFNPGGGKAENQGLPLNEITIADHFRAGGYTTGLVGKWHLGSSDAFTPTQRGFDHFYGFLGGAHPYFPGNAARIFRGKEAITEKEYLTDAFAREAVHFVDMNKAKPFLLYLAFNAVHTPMHATDARLQRFATIGDERRRTYAAMLVAMDEAIGKVLEKLRTENLEEKTLIFFISDNGGPTMPTTTVNGSINSPLRGSKRTTLEGGIRVPFVVQWKGVVPAGKTYENPLIQLDILPTALAAAGIPAKGDTKLDGVNLLPYLKGENKEKPHETLYWRFGAQMAIRQGDWKLVRYDPAVEAAAPKKKDKKNPGDARLYNLAEDIGESRDLAEKFPDKVKALQQTWDRWNAELVQPLWGAGKMN